MDKNYWSKRAEARLINSERTARVAIGNMSGLYNASLERLRTSINTLYNKMSTSTGLDVSELSAILEGSERGNYIQAITRSLRSMGINVNDVITPHQLRQLSRLEAIKSEIKYEILSLAEQEKKLTEQNYQKIIQDTMRGTRADLNYSRGITTEFGGADKRVLRRILNERWVGGTFKTRIGKNANQFISTLQRELGSALVTGQDLAKVQSVLRKRFDISRYDSARLIRTEANHFNNQATLEIYKEDGVTQYEYWAEVDGRTSDICLDLHQQIFRVEDAIEGENYPPLHPNCRSTTLPVIASDLENRPTVIDTNQESQELYPDYVNAPEPQTIADLEERWGQLPTTQGGAESIKIKLDQGGDKAYNAESEWIGQRSKYVTDKQLQEQMKQRIDVIISSMKDEGQKSQVEFLKKYLDFPEPLPVPVKTKTTLDDNNITEWEKKYGGGTKERYAIYDDKGDLLGTGTSNNLLMVEVAEKDIKYLKGNILTHTHPDSDTLLSPSDFEMGLQARVREVRVAGSNNIYAIQFEGIEDMSKAQISKIRREFHDEVVGMYRNKDFTDGSLDRLYRQITDKYGFNIIETKL